MEQFRAICKNPWCKATFLYTEEDMVGDLSPNQCKKCKSFNDELSGGMTWKDKEYEGSRMDGMPHEIKYKVTNYKL